jgi:hypothetical protein
MTIPLDALALVPQQMMPPYKNFHPEAKRLIEYRREFRKISKKYMERAIPNLPPPCLHDSLEDFGLDIETIKALFLDEDRRAVALESLNRAIVYEYPPNRLGYEEILVRAVFSPKTSIREAFVMMERELSIDAGFQQRGGVEDLCENNDWLCDWENGRLSSVAKGSLLFHLVVVSKLLINKPGRVPLGWLALLLPPPIEGNSS